MSMRQAGFTITEILISLAVLGTVSSAIAVKLKADKQILDDTSRLMAQDALEAGVGSFIKSREVVDYSVKRSKNSTLITCFINQGRCYNGRDYEVAFYRLGDSQPMTGTGVLYDTNGKPCTGKCSGGYYFRTFLIPACASGGSCLGPAFVMIRAELYRDGEKQPTRTIVREMERYTGNKFPNLALRCKDDKSVLRGIGMTGGPLCTPLSAVKFQGPKDPKVEVKPGDCRAQNAKGDDQFFVRSISDSGDVQCSAKFW